MLGNDEIIYVVANLNDFLCSVAQKSRYFEECLLHILSLEELRGFLLFCFLVFGIKTQF